MESHRKKFLWSLGGANSPRAVPQVNCDHFGDCGELKIYPATKILTKVLKWWPTDLKKKGRERKKDLSFFVQIIKQTNACKQSQNPNIQQLKMGRDQVELILLR